MANWISTPFSRSSQDPVVTGIARSESQRRTVGSVPKSVLVSGVSSGQRSTVRSLPSTEASCTRIPCSPRRTRSSSLNSTQPPSTNSNVASLPGLETVMTSPLISSRRVSTVPLSRENLKVATRRRRVGFGSISDTSLSRVSTWVVCCVQVVPSSLLASIVASSPTAKPLEPQKRTPCKLAVTSSGGCCLAQLAPPSVVARIVAPSPTTQPRGGAFGSTDEYTKCTARRFAITPCGGSCSTQLSPPSSLASIVASSPTAQALESEK